LNVGFHGYWNKYDDWAGFLKQLGILFPWILQHPSGKVFSYTTPC
jgi:hypothetical protein